MAACKDRPVANSRWMTVSCRSPGDALPVMEDGEFLHPGVEAGVLDGHAGGGGERDDEFLVDVAEHLGRPLVGQVQVPEHLVADQDGHAQERPHRRMVRREAVAVGMLAQVGQPQWLGIDDEEAEDAVASGQVPDRPVCVRVDTHGEELGEAGPALVEHAQCAVAGVDEFGGRGDDPLQHRRQVEIGADRHDAVEEATERLRTGVP
jgi:hypothetical protein